MSGESICDDCIYRVYIKGKTNGPPEDCYPDEEYCEEESENFQTEDGCYRFQESDRE